jgi:hypothetical protein
MHDNSIKHWELKDSIPFGQSFWLRLSCLKLINNKFEIAVFRSNPDAQIVDIDIYFYNIYNDEMTATNFYDSVKNKMINLGKSINFETFDNVILEVEKNIAELNRYKNSVTYTYPEDLFGEKYQ